nr:MAG TPA_asm: hypothetical protein [Caudoviricetes sp.]
MITYLSIGFLFWLVTFLCGRIHCNKFYEHILGMIVITLFYPLLFLFIAIKMCEVRG